MVNSDEWVVVGTDNFSHEDYPLSIHADRYEAIEAASARRAKAHQDNPGPNYLYDTYAPCSMTEATQRLGMSRADVRSLVGVLSR